MTKVRTKVTTAAADAAIRAADLTGGAADVTHIIG
jgi:hypothetical protein